MEPEESGATTMTPSMTGTFDVATSMASWRAPDSSTGSSVAVR